MVVTQSAKGKKRSKPPAREADAGKNRNKAEQDRSLALQRLAVLYFFSGIPALLYQTVWQRLLVLHSGVGSVSVSIIVAAYMLGLGLGSLAGGQLSRKRSPRRLLWLFAGLEMAIAAYAHFSPGFLYGILYRELGWLYTSVPTAAVLHAVTLVLPTMLMGMTLPLLTSAVTQLTSIAPRSISTIYGCNAFGAATGALITPWLIMPFVGVQGVCSLGAAINFLVALSAINLGRRLDTQTATSAESQAREATSEDRVIQSTRGMSFSVWLLLYFLSGFLAIGLEILWFRLLDISVKSTSYTFGTLLAVYLGCLASGSLVGARRTETLTEPVTTYLKTQCLVVILAIVPVLLLMWMPESILARTWLFNYWAGSDPYTPSLSSWSTIALLYVGVPLGFMGASTFCMGYSFAALQRGVHLSAQDSGYRVGMLQAANIVGCVLGSLLVGLWWLADFGTTISLQLLATVGLAFALLGLFVSSYRSHFGVAIVSIAVLTWLLPDSRSLWLRLHGEPATSRMVVSEDVSGVAAAAPEKDKDEWRVSANGKSQSHLPFGGFHAKLGAIPTTLHTRPDSIAIIGLGSGNTAWAAACRSESQSIKVFEVCTAELPLLEALAKLPEHGQLHSFLSDQRINIVGRDARHALMTEPEMYDVIETDAIRPQSAFAGYLYSLEFFELCRSRLKPGGLMCCWSPTTGTFSTFRKAFPHMLILDNGYLLIGSPDPIGVNREAWKARLQAEQVASYLGPDVIRKCLSSIDSASTDAEQFSVPMINTDLFPFDEFH